MALTTDILLRIAATLSSALDLATASVPLNYQKAIALASGTGANQANQIFHDQRTLGPSATEDLDLSGVLTNAFGASVAFTNIKAMLVYASPNNTNDVLVGGASATQFLSWVAAANDVVVVKPGGMLLLAAPVQGYSVTAATADLLKIANSAGVTGVTYDILLIGVG